jgi:ABC-type uncharacterized transport system permease subunit
MVLALACSAALVYLAATWLVWRSESAGLAERVLAPLAAALHGAALAAQVVDGASVRVGVTEAFSLFAWQSALLLWGFGLFKPLRALGLAIYPLTAFAAVWAAAAPTAVSTEPIADWQAAAHIFLALLSAGVLTLATVQACALALQERLLHRHRHTLLARSLPPLLVMERDLFQLVAIGAFLLSLALVTGFWFVHDLRAQHLIHKAVLSCGACAIFGVLLWGRWRFGWRGRTAFAWALCGYLLLVLGYFGSKLVLEEILGRHWT